MEFTPQGYNDDIQHDQDTHDGNTSATWTYSVTPGTYPGRCYVGRARESLYAGAVHDLRWHTTPLATVYVNQELANEGDLTLGGQPFEFIGGDAATYTITSGTLKIEIVNDVPAEGDGSYLIADATYIEELHNIAISSGAGAFYDVEFNGSANFRLQDDLEVNGDLTIAGGTLAASTHTIELSGDWTNNVGAGGFLAETSTVDLVGSSTQTIRGSTDFYHLEVSTATAQTVQFESGQTQSIVAGGSLTLTGASGRNSRSLHSPQPRTGFWTWMPPPRRASLMSRSVTRTRRAAW